MSTSTPPILLLVLILPLLLCLPTSALEYQRTAAREDTLAPLEAKLSIHIVLSHGSPNSTAAFESDTAPATLERLTLLGKAPHQSGGCFTEVTPPESAQFRGSSGVPLVSCASVAPPGIPCTTTSFGPPGDTLTLPGQRVHRAQVFVSAPVAVSFRLHMSVDGVSQDGTCYGRNTAGCGEQFDFSYRFCAMHEDAFLVAHIVAARSNFSAPLLRDLASHTDELATRALRVVNTVVELVAVAVRLPSASPHSSPPLSLATLHRGTRHGLLLWLEAEDGEARTVKGRLQTCLHRPTCPWRLVLVEAENIPDVCGWYLQVAPVHVILTKSAVGEEVGNQSTVLEGAQPFLRFVPPSLSPGSNAEGDGGTFGGDHLSRLFIQPYTTQGAKTSSTSPANTLMWHLSSIDKIFYGTRIPHTCTCMLLLFSLAPRSLYYVSLRLLRPISLSGFTASLSANGFHTYPPPPSLSSPPPTHPHTHTHRYRDSRFVELHRHRPRDYRWYLEYTSGGSYY